MKQNYHFFQMPIGVLLVSSVCLQSKLLIEKQYDFAELFGAPKLTPSLSRCYIDGVSLGAPKEKY
ncbi:MAG: hypothetical protein WCG27_02210 [Pseudomonadota bacterium]